ncbi:MAG: hypothetical protein IJE89_02910 [Bacilli bacterium]|nr:hypothetical protein [Bacilli bacterium]
MNGNLNQSRRSELTIPDIERQIRNNQYKSKEELADYILDLRKKGLLNIDNRQIKELLDLFDELHKITNTTLDMSNYRSVDLEQEDLIISKESDRILTTQEGTSAFTDEFKQKQNEIIANNNEKSVDADKVFNKMATQEKEELTLMTLDEAFVYPNISIELLMKIKFFVTNILINPNVFRININTGIFYNIENNEAYEVRKNEDTQEYEIYKETEKIYGSSTDNQQENTESLEQGYESPEQKLNKPKVRRLVPDNPSTPNAAFTKIGFLIMSIITFVLLTLMTLLLMK